ncbi:hypothetical protein C2S53_017888 [Perilla frutescens var. hirtella]|uniref:Leucine-rich repeat-containing N-terminal plant-type domain-containing protein n=1 Tax=Perilla frutescens var. hirtella TaxID=608512 RepID=A0AAD4NWM0_PERFH|nr:hypothetical protein C2S53_017888 [Perilla frutescens var. hirtella]
MFFHKGISIGFLVLLCMEYEYYDHPHLVSAAEVLRCVEQEREALLRFKEGLVDDSGLLSSWGSEASKMECCKWKGVVCSNTNTAAHVMSLLLGFNDSDYLYFQPLGGKISDALLELHHLTNLDLSGNQFDDQFPEFIGSMKQLKHLNLQECFFNVTVPPQLGNLTNLQTLDLSLNSFWSESDNLNWLSHLSLLTRLDLSFSFDLSHTNWLQQILKLRSLQELYLDGSNIAGAIPSANYSFASLSTLDLSYNEFTSTTLDWLFNISTSLATLYMFHNNLDGSIPDVFGRLVFLEDLDLSGNMLEGGISKSLGNLSHLQTLSLSNNDFRGDLDELFKNLSTKVWMSLESLNLSYNQLIGSLLDLKAFPTLRNLYLGSNKFTGSMPESLSQHSVLEQLDVSFNLLEGTISEANLTKLYHLKRLDLSFNSLTLQIAQDWSPPFQLNYIRLGGCKMSLPHFPKWIQTQRNVEWLDLSYAGISDEVPKWLWSFSPALSSLNISHNQISGVIPDLSSTSIDMIDVSSNKFSGPVPLFPQNISSIQFSQNMFLGSISSICTVQSKYALLDFLDLSNNQLYGEIPTCWEKMSALEYLNLGDNSFWGEIPYTLGTLYNINSLHLRGNNLSGELPSTLKNGTELLFIDVGGNKLTGNIPEWIGANKYLMYVILSRNKFKGSIPPEICNLTYIRVLDLSRNHLSGEIPQCFNKFISLSEKTTATAIPGVAITYFPTLYEPLKQFEYAFVQWKGGEFEYRKILQHLRLIDLSSNRLMGSIPVSFSSMRGLVSLNLSRNLLKGTIISDIGQMEMLEVLDLSRNQLSGEIPISLAQLHFLAFLDLANNSLSGKIPTSTQLQSFNASFYAGNNELCGLPLKMCPEDVPSSSITIEGRKGIKKDGGIKSLSFLQGFGISMAFGFIVGFWGVIGSLFLKRSWRWYAYFNFLDEADDWLYKATVVPFRRFRRRN